MKSRKILPGFLYLILLITHTACSEQPNQSPSLEIVTPQEGSFLMQGEIIPIRAVADDEDGSISELSIYIEGETMGTTASSSLVYNWDTEGGDLGEYVLSATATDNQDKSVAVNITVVLDGPGGFNPDLEYGSMSDTEGNTYRTMELGNQVWMAENLKSTRYADGTPINEITDEAEWNAMTPDVRAYCWFNNLEEYRDSSGALYTWAAAMNGEISSEMNPSGVQGVCPDGWHIPSDDEWKELEVLLGMDQSASDRYDWRGSNQGGQLKETGFSSWDFPNTGASNSSGLTAVPGGFRSAKGLYYGHGLSAAFWTSTEEEGTGNSWYRTLNHDKEQVYRQYNDMRLGMSVRCVQD